MLRLKGKKLIAHMRKLGRSRSKKKADSSRANGKLGGRPRKVVPVLSHLEIAKGLNAEFDRVAKLAANNIRGFLADPTESPDHNPNL